jgi:hypothetical protein
MVSLPEFVGRVPGFAQLVHAERIKHFVWFLQSIQGRHSVTVPEIRACYDLANNEIPANLARSVEALTEKKPPDLLKSGGKYRLHAVQREKLDARYGRTESVIAIEQTLAELPAKLRSESERIYLEETLACYRHRAFRAAIVMVWILAYDHLLGWILADGNRLAKFNEGIAKRNSKKAHTTISRHSDFEELKEDEVVDIVGNLSGITANMKRSLKEKLGRRNMYAHPSTMAVSRHQVDDMISDLVYNIVLQLGEAEAPPAAFPASAASTP